MKKKFSDLEIKTMYRELCLNDKVSFSCFNNAIQGLEKIEELKYYNEIRIRVEDLDAGNGKVHTIAEMEKMLEAIK